MSGNNTIVGGGRVAKVVGDLLGLEDFLAPWPGALEKVTAAADLIRDAECMLALLKDAFVTCEVKQAPTSRRCSRSRRPTRASIRRSH
jgi:hypothetical protein